MRDAKREKNARLPALCSVLVAREAGGKSVRARQRSAHFSLFLPRETQWLLHYMSSLGKCIAEK